MNQIHTVQQIKENLIENLLKQNKMHYNKSEISAKIYCKKALQLLNLSITK